MTGQTVLKGQVIGIGKLKVPRAMDFNFEIPMLSFIVIKKPDGKYASTCLHLLVDGYGAAVDIAVDDMINAIESFLRSNFDNLSFNDAWNNLKDLSHANEHTAPLWNAYRDFQYDMAAEGESIDTIEALRKKINQLSKRVEQLEKENSDLKKRFEDARGDIIVDFLARKGAIAA